MQFCDYFVIVLTLRGFSYKMSEETRNFDNCGRNNKYGRAEKQWSRKTEKLEEITIKDIARMCGVGVSTVSRAINNHPDINPETKQKVMDIIQKYGYIPNNSARYLKRWTESVSLCL